MPPVVASVDPWARCSPEGAAGAVFVLRADVIVTLLGTSVAGIALHLLGLVG
jgi:chromate transporter